MKKTAVIYWSGTGNTKQMAEAVAEGMKSAGAEAVVLEPAQVDGSTFSGVDAVAFGCPAMGSEVLEEMEFEPMFSACKNSLGGKKGGFVHNRGWTSPPSRSKMLLIDSESEASQPPQRGLPLTGSERNAKLKNRRLPL